MSIDPRRRRPAVWARSVALSLTLVGSLVASGQDDPQPPPEEPEAVPAEPYAGDLQDPDPAAADAEGGVPSGSYLATSLALGGGWEEGFLLEDPEAGDAVYRVVPRLLLVHRPSGRTELVLAYAPELEGFDRYSDLDAVHHAAGGLFRHDLSRKTGLLAGASFLDGEDPTRQLGGLTALLPRVPFRETRFHAGLDHRWQRTVALLYLGRTRTEIEPGPGVLTAGVDETENVGSLTLVRNLTVQTDASVTYSYIDPESRTLADPPVPADGTGEAPEPAGLDAPIQTVTLGLGHRFSPRVAFQVSGGILEQRDELSWVGAAELVRSGDPFSFRVGYDRSLLSLGSAGGVGGGVPVQPATPTAALGDSLTDAVRLGFLARLRDRVRWIQLLEAARTELPEGDTLETLGASSRMVVEASRRVGSFLEVGYLDQRGSDLFGAPTSRWGASLGLIVGLSGPRSAWGVRDEPETLYRVLPSRRGGFDG